jgi:hypothetical protein
VEVVGAKIKGRESATLDEFKLKLEGGDGGYRFKESRPSGK